MLEHLAILPLALLIGIVLGALGSGGAILALPILVYVAALPVRQAVAVSQLVVGTAALVGTLLQARRGNVVWGQALVFASIGMPATWIGARLAKDAEPHWLMIGFALIITIAGFRMLQTAHVVEKGKIQIGVSLLVGAIVGLLTGLLGVGGGFMLVPALIAFGGMDTRQATATSLPVVAVNSLSGAVHQVDQWTAVLGLAMLFLGATLVGTFIGVRMARSVSELKLKQALGFVLISVGVVVGIVNFKV